MFVLGGGRAHNIRAGIAPRPQHRRRRQSKYDSANTVVIIRSKYIIIIIILYWIAIIILALKTFRDFHPRPIMRFDCNNTTRARARITCTMLDLTYSSVIGR